MKRRLGNYIHEDRLGAHSSRFLWLWSYDDLPTCVADNEVSMRIVVEYSVNSPFRNYLTERITHAKTSQE